MLHRYRLIVTVLAVSSAQADTIFVDANCPGGDGSIGDPYCSIQTAIDNAVDTDEIVVAPGTYFETIDFLGKAIWLHSSDGPEVTIIDATGLGIVSVVNCISGEGPDTVLQGVTVTGGTGSALFMEPAGGGMLNLESSPTVTNCTFSGNSADVGGGMFNLNSSDPTVTNCTFSGNSAFTAGGGMANSNDSSPTVTGCMFSGNTANVFGGGMLNLGSSPALTNCTFFGNTADEGGGMFNSFSSPTVTNCTFSGNAAGDQGGGMVYFGVCNPTVTNCTFALNSAANGNALGFDFGPSELVMTNCILWDGGDEIGNNDGSTLTITYTDVQGVFPGTGNIDADPLFVDPNNGNLRLAPGSPCIDAANNIAVPAGVTTDLDGNPRFHDDVGTVDTGVPGNGHDEIVDMGAYEFQGTSCPWDCTQTGDGNVGISDFLLLLAQWDGPGSCDIDGGGVGITDFLELLANWGPCP